MLMPMVDIRKMTMDVRHWLVPVRMRVWLFAIPREIVFVLMMSVVAVFMGMVH